MHQRAIPLLSHQTDHGMAPAFPWVPQGYTGAILWTVLKICAPIFRPQITCFIIAHELLRFQTQSYNYNPHTFRQQKRQNNASFCSHVAFPDFELQYTILLLCKHPSLGGYSICGQEIKKNISNSDIGVDSFYSKQNNCISVVNSLSLY